MCTVLCYKDMLYQCVKNSYTKVSRGFKLQMFVYCFSKLDQRLSIWKSAI